MLVAFFCLKSAVASNEHQHALCVSCVRDPFNVLNSIKMGSDAVPVFRELPNKNFLDLIEDCCHILSDWRADAYQISALNERLGFKFTCERNGLLTGPCAIAILLAHRLIEPDNVSALTHLADVAGRPDLKDLLNRYTYTPSLLTCQTGRIPQNHEEGIQNQIIFEMQLNNEIVFL